MTDREHAGIVAAVWSGALVLAGVPTIAIVATAMEAALSTASVPRPAWVQVLLGVVAVAIGLQVATELARVRLHGFQELHRGSGARTLGRHAILLVPAVGFLWYMGAIVFVEVAAEVEGLTDPVGVVAFGLLAPVFGFVVVRIGRSFLAGREAGLTSRRAVQDAE